MKIKLFFINHLEHVATSDVCSISDYMHKRVCHWLQGISYVASPIHWKLKWHKICWPVMAQWTIKSCPVSRRKQNIGGETPKDEVWTLPDFLMEKRREKKYSNSAYFLKTSTAWKTINKQLRQRSWSQLSHHHRMFWWSVWFLKLPTSAPLMSYCFKVVV